ncbi:MAG TPA: PhoH family protein [Armatimonadota bacterium]
MDIPTTTYASAVDALSSALTTISFANYDEAAAVLGPHDCHLRAIEREFDANLILRGATLTIESRAGHALQVLHLIEELQHTVRLGQPVTLSEVQYAATAVHHRQADPGDAVFAEVLLTTHRGKQIKPKSAHQRAYVEAMRVEDLVFGIGPAGTGKTYLAVAMAVAALNAKLVQRIMLTRPAVEAGERLGFLPGDLQEKINPYLRPLYDALYDMMEMEKVDRLLEKKVIEVAPLAFMRGRTLNDAFIIMDEAQNTTPEQMKMFLTRLGFGSRAVVTGDITQIDLPIGQRSGLIEVRHILEGVEGLRFVNFDDHDVVRHPLVQRIVKAYEAQPTGQARGSRV